jgi:hypothetical protein
MIFAPLILIRKQMTVVSSKEFKTNQDKYLRLAINEQIFIKKGNNMLTLTMANSHNNANDVAELSLAMERRNGEFTSSDEFIKFMENNIQNGIHG